MSQEKMRKHNPISQDPTIYSFIPQTEVNHQYYVYPCFVEHWGRLSPAKDAQDEGNDLKINIGFYISNSYDHSFPPNLINLSPPTKTYAFAPFILPQSYAFIINYLFKFRMDFPRTKRCTQSTRESMDLLTSIENENEKSSSVSQPDINSKKWGMDHQKCFIRFWASRLLQSPLEVLSFNTPLKRSSYFKEMSAFITKFLGVQYYKSPKQCKSRFGAIKRRVLKEQKSGRRRKNYDFLDYIIEQGNRFAVEEGINPRTEFGKTIQRLTELTEKESDFMIHTKKMLRFDLCSDVEQKNNDIVRYLKMQNMALK